MPESKRTVSGYLATGVVVVILYGIDRGINIYQNHQRLNVLATERAVSRLEFQVLHSENETSKRDRIDLFRRLKAVEKALGIPQE